MIWNHMPYLQIVQMLKDAAADPNTSIVALTGAGNFFCSGNDLRNRCIDACCILWIMSSNSFVKKRGI